MKMGATSNANTARHSLLQERKLAIEKVLLEKNEELKNLCIQEAELTGIMPAEIPLEPGESPPIFRRKVGTTFQLPHNLIHNLNNQDDSIAALELQIQLHMSMAEAAQSLANAPNVNKTVRRQNLSQYDKHKKEIVTLEKKLNLYLKYCNTLPEESYDSLHQKHKKKPRSTEIESAVPMNAEQSGKFVKMALRHSMRSLQHPLSVEDEVQLRQANYQKLVHRNSEGNPYHINYVPGQTDDEHTSSSYKAYMERKKNDFHPIPIPNHYATLDSNFNMHEHQTQPRVPYSPTSIQTLPNTSKVYSLKASNYNYPNADNHNLKYNTHSVGAHSRQPSVIVYNNYHGKSPYYAAHAYNAQANYRDVVNGNNPHQLQPHQQYEQDVMATGLGGFWNRSESGELTWCSVAPNDLWQCDKKFGSLDRRRNKRMHKRSTQPIDSKSATGVPYPESLHKVTPKKFHQVGSLPSRIDTRQLVRTQSLGSVGAHTTDVWPNDDNNSSCGSDAQSMNENGMIVRRHKQKEWYETSLDGPVAPTVPSSPLAAPLSHSVVSTIASISPEQKYEAAQQQQQQQQQIQNHSSPSNFPPLSPEIPAESSRLTYPNAYNSFIELFNNNNNNNLPKHGTVIQLGQCKPYHEETKPFEMSDFYKYSTKFNKSPNKHGEEEESTKSYDSKAKADYLEMRPYQPYASMVCKSFSPNSKRDRTISANSSHSSQIGEEYSTGINDWYDVGKTDSQRSSPTPSGSRSATLV